MNNASRTSARCEIGEIVTFVTFATNNKCKVIIKKASFFFASNELCYGRDKHFAVATETHLSCHGYSRPSDMTNMREATVENFRNLPSRSHCKVYCYFGNILSR